MKMNTNTSHDNLTTSTVVSDKLFFLNGINVQSCDDSAPAVPELPE